MGIQSCACVFEDRYDCKFGLAETMPITTAINAAEKRDYLATTVPSVYDALVERYKVLADIDNMPSYVPASRRAKRSWKSDRSRTTQHRGKEPSAKILMSGLIAIDNAS